MRDPIAYTYEADVHCPACAVARFGRESRISGGFYPWPPEDARDSEGNPVGAVAPWDDVCEDCEDGRPETFCRLVCGTCGGVISEHCHWTDRDECATARERSVAGTDRPIPACPEHGPHPDYCECGHPGYDGHDMRTVPPACLTPGCPCGHERED